jgi:V/A-type H+-transporting ATPase subunit D
MPSTKSNLLRLREELEFLEAGRELLDQKREFLSEALLGFEAEAVQLRQRLEERLAALYEQVADAQGVLGEAALESLAWASVPIEPFEARQRSLMGVVIPVVQHPSAPEGQPASGLRAAAGEDGVAAEAAAAGLRALVPSLAELAELETSCLRLAADLLRTRRKLNALEAIHIPAHRETVRFIADQLEEREREALFQLRRLRSHEGGRA